MGLLRARSGQAGALNNVGWYGIPLGEYDLFS